MTQYLLVFLVLFLGSVSFYLLYERYFRRAREDESTLYVEALQNLIDGKQESAFTKLRQVVADDSSNVDAYLRLGQILRNYNKPDRALQVHKDLTLRGNLTADQKLDILRQLYSDYHDLDDLDMARAVLSEMIGLDSKNSWAYSRLLELQKQTRQWDEAFKTAEALLKLQSERSRKPLATFKYHLGREQMRQREHHKARALFKEALGLDPSHVDSYLAIGDSYAEEERFEDAVGFWNKMIEKVPSQGHLAIERLKKTLFDLGRFGDIIDICQGILDHSPDNVEARQTLAEFYVKKGDYEAAEELLGQLVDDRPDELQSVFALIRLYLEREDSGRLASLLKRLEKNWDNRSDGGTADRASTDLVETK